MRQLRLALALVAASLFVCVVGGAAEPTASTAAADGGHPAQVTAGRIHTHGGIEESFGEERRQLGEAAGGKLKRAEAKSSEAIIDHVQAKLKKADHLLSSKTTRKAEAAKKIAAKMKKKSTNLEKARVKANQDVVSKASRENAAQRHAESKAAEEAKAQTAAKVANAKAAKKAAHRAQALAAEGKFVGVKQSAEVAEKAAVAAKEAARAAGLDEERKEKGSHVLLPGDDAAAARKKENAAWIADWAAYSAAKIPKRHDNPHKASPSTRSLSKPAAWRSLSVGAKHTVMSPTTLRQEVTFSNLLSATVYKGDNKATYELGYGKANGLTTNTTNTTNTTGTVQFLEGVKVTSKWHRATKVAFVATMTNAYKGTKPAATSTASAAAIATAITAVVKDNKVTGVTAPKASEMSVAPAKVTDGATQSEMARLLMAWCPRHAHPTQWCDDKMDLLEVDDLSEKPKHKTCAWTCKCKQCFKCTVVDENKETKKAVGIHMRFASTAQKAELKLVKDKYLQARCEDSHENRM
jgi:hypothetical protein